MDYYGMIFKRKSFHLFRDSIGVITAEQLTRLEDFISQVEPLDPTIKTEIRIVSESETSCKRGAQYCILFYSEKKKGYLRNIGYIGEQIDLYLASENIGALWFGIGKTEEKQVNGLDYVIMIAIAAMPQDKFRKDVFKSKRKPLSETWKGEELGIADIVRFSPSACNTQPWYTVNEGDRLTVYRYKKEGKRGIMPAYMVAFYNRIDIGIYLFLLEVCLKQQNIEYERELFDDETDDKELTVSAKYILRR
ncbi:MAG: nitroreductase [Erysipelotrichaceae bacterium]|nr:nitroreductase [Erysipelotrichaceae bacterium]